VAPRDKVPVTSVQRYCKVCVVRVDQSRTVRMEKTTTVNRCPSVLHSACHPSVL